MTRRVVVGWDGSAAAAGALDWAARHYPQAESVDIVEVDGAARRRGGPHQDPEDAARALRESHPDLNVTVSVERGGVTESLAERSAPDVLIALGARGDDEARLGRRTSTAYRVALNARGPVAVVPQGYRGGRNVVVGVSGTSQARGVVLTAAAEAVRRRQRLIAVQVTESIFGVGALPGDSEKADHEQHEHEQQLREALAPVAEAYPDLPVVPHLLRGRASDLLLGESRGAMLLVLGGGGEPRGSARPVTHRSLLLSRAPVMVVPPDAEVP